MSDEINYLDGFPVSNVSIIADITPPSPDDAIYWIDLAFDGNGKVIKYYDKSINEWKQLLTDINPEDTPTIDKMWEEVVRQQGQIIILNADYYLVLDKIRVHTESLASVTDDLNALNKLVSINSGYISNLRILLAKYGIDLDNITKSVDDLNVYSKIETIPHDELDNTKAPGFYLTNEQRILQGRFKRNIYRILLVVTDTTSAGPGNSTNKIKQYLLDPTSDIPISIRTYDSTISQEWQEWQYIREAKDGEDGKNAYVHIKYSDNATGNPMRDTPDNSTYMGILANHTEKAPTNPSEYTWVKFKGDDGEIGPIGPIGKDGKDGATGTVLDYNITIYKSSADRPNTPNINIPEFQNPEFQLYDKWSRIPDVYSGTIWSSVGYVDMKQSFNGKAGKVTSWSVPTKMTGEDGSSSVYWDFKYNANNDFTKWDWGAIDFQTGKTQQFFPQEHGWVDDPSTISNRGSAVWFMTGFRNSEKPEEPMIINWSNPKLFNGKDGKDGNGVENIFCLSTSPVFPGAIYYPTGDQYTDQSILPYENAIDEDNLRGWFFDPQDVTPTWKYQYISERKKINGVWSQYSIPALWSVYSVGETGKDGEQGLPGSPIRMRGEWIGSTSTDIPEDLGPDSTSADSYYMDGDTSVVNNNFVDVVYIRNGGEYTYYACIRKHPVYLSPMPGTSEAVEYWRKFTQFEAVATELLLAEHAFINIFSTRGIMITKDYQTGSGWLIQDKFIKYVADVDTPEKGIKTMLTKDGHFFSGSNNLETEITSSTPLRGYDYCNKILADGTGVLGKMPTSSGAYAIAWNTDGSGTLASGNIAWNTDGSGAIGNPYPGSGKAAIRWDAAGALTISGLTIESWSSQSEDGTIDTINGVFKVTPNGLDPTIQFNSDGSGFLSSGKINWKADGSGSIGGNINWDTNGNVEYKGKLMGTVNGSFDQILISPNDRLFKMTSTYLDTNNLNTEKIVGIWGYQTVFYPFLGDYSVLNTSLLGIYRTARSTLTTSQRRKYETDYNGYEAAALYSSNGFGSSFIDLTNVDDPAEYKISAYNDFFGITSHLASGDIYKGIEVYISKGYSETQILMYRIPTSGGSTKSGRLIVNTSDGTLRLV